MQIDMGYWKHDRGRVLELDSPVERMIELNGDYLEQRFSDIGNTVLR
jgi:hypothetical protein